MFRCFVARTSWHSSRYNSSTALDSRHSVELAEFPKAIVQVMNLVNANTSQPAHGKAENCPMGMPWQDSWDLWMFITYEYSVHTHTIYIYIHIYIYA